MEGLGAKNRIEFGETKELLQKILHKVGIEDEPIIPTTRPTFGPTLTTEPSLEQSTIQFWKETEKFCGQSQQEILGNASNRNTMNCI